MLFPVFIAIDTSSLEEASLWINLLKNYVVGFKFGLQFFLAHGKKGIESLIKQKTEHNLIFIDLKFFDIPNTVYHAIKEIKSLNPDIITVHINGGGKMLQKSKEIAGNTCIFGVTILTSIDQEDIKVLGLNKKSYLNNLISLAEKSEISGLICASEDVQYIRESKKNRFKLIVPGIRSNIQRSDDQKRISTAQQTIENGADYLVIGRPITKSHNPQKALEELFI